MHYRMTSMKGFQGRSRGIGARPTPGWAAARRRPLDRADDQLDQRVNIRAGGVAVDDGRR